MSLPSKSVFGTNQTYESGVMRSASERIADIPSSNVCLGVESGSTGRFSHSLLMTLSGHLPPSVVAPDYPPLG